MKTHGALVIAAVSIVCGVGSAQAAHKDVKHCANDYRNFCHQWGLETKGLENCMRKHGDKLTNACGPLWVISGHQGLDLGCPLYPLRTDMLSVGINVR